MKKHCLNIAYAFSLLMTSLGAEEVVVRTPAGNSLSFDLNTDLPFCEVVKQIESYLELANNGETQNESELLMDFTEENMMKMSQIGENEHLYALADEGQESKTKARLVLDFMFGSTLVRAATAPREYKTHVTAGEKENIRYIVTTLASGSWLDLMGKQSKLKKVGDQIDHIHPLSFLSCVFSDEELKAGFHAIYNGGGRIWKEFFTNGLAKSLSQESDRNNLQRKQIEDFASTLNLNASTISPSLKNKKWEEFAAILVRELPRGGNPGRYDQ